MNRSTPGLLVMVLLITILLPTVPVAAARCFPETNHCLDGRIQQYWEQHGGLPVFGFPITAQAPEQNNDSGQTYITQWMERNRFELHPQNAAPYDVLLGRLGDDRLRQLGRDWRSFPRAPDNAPNYFAETGHAIAHPAFWRFWSSHGLEFDGRPGFSFSESLALFGMPLSEPVMETNSSGHTVLTQWFERARFEDHGTQGVKLGLLGNEVRGTDRPTNTGATIRLAWFYRPPGDETTIDTLLQNYDDFILTHKDESYRDRLHAGGVKQIYQYLVANQIRDPGSCTATPWSNQVAYKAGDFCRLSQEHPDWFLLDTNGNRIKTSSTTYMMDPGNAGWREFFLARMQEMQTVHGWRGVFLDNIDGSRARATRTGATPARYPDDKSYQVAVEGYLKFLADNYFKPQKIPALANITEIKDVAVWFTYLQYLDGAMEEAFAVGWGSSYRSPTTWESHLARIEQTQAQGKLAITVAQGKRDDLQRQQFAFGSYLLVTNNNATFRYGSTYNESWIYDNYRVQLGRPVGKRYRDGSGWRRDFEHGSVWVDPAERTAIIRTR